MPRTRTEDQAEATFAQIEYLAKLCRKSLKRGDIPRAIEQIEGCIRLVHGLRDSKEKRRMLLACAVSDHWRLGCCHAALGPEHYGRALGHLNVVRRYSQLIRRKRHLELDEASGMILCHSLATMARVCNLQARHDMALLRADEGLDALYRNEELCGTPAADLVQMLCFAARGDALRGLGHGGEVVVRHYEQVLVHYRRYVSDSADEAKRRRLSRSTGKHFPWLQDRLHPEAILEGALQAMEAMHGSVPDEIRAWMDKLVGEIRIWKDSEN